MCHYSNFIDIINQFTVLCPASIATVSAFYILRNSFLIKYNSNSFSYLQFETLVSNTEFRRSVL